VSAWQVERELKDKLPARKQGSLSWSRSGLDEHNERCLPVDGRNLAQRDDVRTCAPPLNLVSSAKSLPKLRAQGGCKPRAARCCATKSSPRAAVRGGLRQRTRDACGARCGKPLLSLVFTRGWLRFFTPMGTPPPLESRPFLSVVARGLRWYRPTNKFKEM